MSESVVLELTRQGLFVSLMVGMPIMAVALFVGVLVSVFQAVTQVQEMTLTYVPKLVAAGLVILFMGNWMIQTLVGFMRLCFDYAARVGMG